MSLTGVRAEVVERATVDEPPLAFHHRALAPFDWMGHALGVADVDAVGQSGIVCAAQQRH